MILQPGALEAYKLFHEGTLALARAERTGILVDVDYFQGQASTLGTSMSEQETVILETKEGKLWYREFGDKMSVQNDGQLEHLLFRKLGVKPQKLREDESGSVDKEALRLLSGELPFLGNVLEWRKAKKTLDFVRAILREQVGGVLHPFFNLHTVITYRSSSDSPNFQNFPKRDPDMSKAVRYGFRARPGFILVEIDYGGLEVRIACCYHRDPTMVQWLTTGFDMHRRSAGRGFFVSEELPDYWKDKTPGSGKDVRYVAKNKFVFPEFYGDYWKNCAAHMWAACTEMNLKAPDGRPMLEHLRQCGIYHLVSATTDPKARAPTDPRAFETHVYKLERVLWDETHPVYRDWKVQWHEQYLRRGYLDLLTGFRVEGAFTKKDVINYPVQGAAFHCLLWSFIELTKLEARGQLFGAHLVGQIHDSIIAEVPTQNLMPFLQTVDDIMAHRIRKAWPWIIVPLEVEAEASPEGGRWSEMKGVKIEAA